MLLSLRILHVDGIFSCIQHFQSAVRSSARAESSWSPTYSTRALSACVAIARVLWVSGRNGQPCLSPASPGNGTTRVRIPLGILYRILLRARREKINMAAFKAP